MDNITLKFGGYMNTEIYLKAKLGDEEAIKIILDNFEGLVVKQCSFYNLKGYTFEDLKQIAYSAIIEGIIKISIEYIQTAPAYIITCIKNSLRNEARKSLSKPDLDSLNNVNDAGVEFIETLVSDYNIEDDVIKNLYVKDAIDGYNKLSTEEKDILSWYIINPYGGLKEYSSLYHKDYRRVRYIKDCIMKKLKSYM